MWEVPGVFVLAFTSFIILLVVRTYLRLTLGKGTPKVNDHEECIVITGCEFGVGRDIALRFVENGFTVFACFPKGAFPSKQDSKNLLPFCVNTRSNDSVQKLGRDIKKELSKGDRRLFAVVNTAEVLINGPIEMQPIESISDQFDVNTLGHIRVIQETLPFIRESKGRIINVISIAGRVTTSSLGIYSATKHAMEAITDALRGELKPWNISVSAIEHGAIDTEIARTEAEEETFWENLKPEAKDIYSSLYKETIKMGKKGKLALQGVSVDHVFKAILHATTSRYPKTRYLVGNDARGFALLKWCCSDVLFDALDFHLDAVVASFFLILFSALMISQQLFVSSRPEVW